MSVFCGFAKWKNNTNHVNLVLDFTLELSGESPKGIPLQELLEFVGMFPPEDLEEIKQAIEEGCGQVDESEW